MKKSKLSLAQLKVKSFTILTDMAEKQTIAGGARDTTPAPPLTSGDKPIDVPPTGFICPSENFCPSGYKWC